MHCRIGCCSGSCIACDLLQSGVRAGRAQSFGSATVPVTSRSVGMRSRL